MRSKPDPKSPVRDAAGRLTKEEKIRRQKERDQGADIARVIIPLPLHVYRALVVKAATAKPAMLKPHALAAQILTEVLSK